MMGLFRRKPPSTPEPSVTEHPSEGVLVSPDVLRVVNTSAVTVSEALERAATPIAIEYRTLRETEITRFRTVPINASVQESMVQIVKSVHPSKPTLYRVVLPKGAELVKAAGQSGFRGFAHGGTGISVHAVLKPVAVGGAMAAGWPLLAVAATVMVVDIAARRELLAHQQKVLALLGRQEERDYNDRIAHQRALDTQLSRAISLVLDGRSANLESDLKGARQEFQLCKLFLEKQKNSIQQLVGQDGKVDYSRVKKLLGGEDGQLFARELHLAHGAIAIMRKALLADAAGLALADPDNPYTAMCQFLDSDIRQVTVTEKLADTVTEQLATLTLRGGWPFSPKTVSSLEHEIRTLAPPPDVEDHGVELRFLRTGDGKIRRVISSDDENEVGPN